MATAKKVKGKGQPLPKHQTPTVVHTTQQPMFYGQHWTSLTDGKIYGHVKGKNHQVVFPSQAYKDVRSWLKLMAKIGWVSKGIVDPNYKQPVTTSA